MKTKRTYRPGRQIPTTKLMEMHKMHTEFAVDTKTDAHRILRSEAEVIAYLAEYGLTEDDCEWERQSPIRVRVIIPAFAEAIERYSAAKAIDCARWGCE